MITKRKEITITMNKISLIITVLLSIFLITIFASAETVKVTQPYTFIKGQPAKSSEVNKNFDLAYDYISKLVELVCKDYPYADICIRGLKPETFTNSIGMTFVLIQPGTFMMGSPLSEPERDDSNEIQHEVTLTKAYYMQTTEITQAQWKAIMGTNPSRRTIGDDCPVDSISWSDCINFIQNLNEKEGNNTYRLPTEAEWEYAARAGTTTPYAFGNDLSSDEANYETNTTIPVGSLKANSWGLYVMHGNIMEWCQDWYSSIYPTGSVVDPVGPSSGTNRVLRGGNWYSKAHQCRSAFRYSSTPASKQYVLGARIARTNY